MVESTVKVDVSYDVNFEMKKHFTPSELTGKSLPSITPKNISLTPHLLLNSKKN